MSGRIADGFVQGLGHELGHNLVAPEDWNDPMGCACGWSDEVAADLGDYYDAWAVHVGQMVAKRLQVMFV